MILTILLGVYVRLLPFLRGERRVRGLLVVEVSSYEKKKINVKAPRKSNNIQPKGTIHLGNSSKYSSGITNAINVKSKVFILFNRVTSIREVADVVNT